LGLNIEELIKEYKMKQAEEAEEDEEDEDGEKDD
jgi:hypothetical protein